MFARTSLILALIVSLLFVTQAQPMNLPVEMKQGGMCAGMQCARGCCAHKTCCATVEQKQALQPPTAPQSQPPNVLFLALELRAYTFLLPPPAPRRPVVMHDDIWTAHVIPPLAVSCIRLI
jgi:hypothetical protein